jgi:dUTP pyrophosphatase
MRVGIESDGFMPSKGHPTDAGYDLRSPVDFTVLPQAFSPRVDLRVGFQVPEGFCGYVVERSSQGKRGIGAIGPVVDHGYTGNVHVTLVNNSATEEYAVKRGDRICQMLLVAVGSEELEQAETLDGERGDASHGSTGV